MARARWSSCWSAERVLHDTSERIRVLLVTDLTYQARGRRYCDEDIALSARLREHVDVALCHPGDAAALMSTGAFDVVLVRNSGPVIHYPEVYAQFRERALAAGAAVLPELTGKADMRGKQYLLDLTGAGFPVIPTVARTADLAQLPDVDTYVVKPLHGADSVGLRYVRRDELAMVGDESAGADVLIQPRVDLRYEVSFYFVGRTFHYALHAPDPEQRWVLEGYEPTAADLAFAQRFVDWNAVEHGIQRVDACRTTSGELLLVELEDLNPYLSLDRVPAEVVEEFVVDLVRAIRSVGTSPAPTQKSTDSLEL